MQRKGIRGTWNSPAGLKPDAVPTGALVDRDMVVGRMLSAGAPIVDSRMFTTDPILGVYLASEDMGRFEQQLNRPISAVTAFTDSNNPDITANDFPFWLQWPGDRKLILSHALIGFGWDMADSASGAHDADYQQAVDNLIPWKDRILSIRIGWEFNVNNGYPWSQGGAGGSNQTPTNYADSFNRFATKIREGLPGVLIDWCPLADHALPDPWYPGDDVVDVIGNDVYVKQAFHSNSFSQVLNWSAGLNWQEQFAQAHGKLMGFAEWAIDYTDGARWIQQMSEWMKRPRANRVVYQAYWNSNDVVSTKLDDLPLNLAAYKAAFAEL
jgi:hypothetical protein